MTLSGDGQAGRLEPCIFTHKGKGALHLLAYMPGPVKGTRFMPQWTRDELQGDRIEGHTVLDSRTINREARCCKRSGNLT